MERSEHKLFVRTYPALIFIKPYLYRLGIDVTATPMR
jgi:hypothetical protein